MKKQLKFPDYNDEKKVSDWLDKTDFSEYVEPSDLKKINLPDLKPSKRLLSLRVEATLIEKAKKKAAKLHIPYQTLMRQILHQGLA